MEKYVFYGIYVIAYVIYLFECVVNSTPPKAEVEGSSYFECSNYFKMAYV